MPFGLTNDPITIHRKLNIFLSVFYWRTSFNYLGDVIVFSESFNTHPQDVNMTQSMIQKAFISLHLGKCWIFKDSVKYLEKVIRPGALTIDEARKKRLRQLRHPKMWPKFGSSAECATFPNVLFQDNPTWQSYWPNSFQTGSRRT